MQNNLDLTFEELKEVIKRGYISVGDYIYPDYKSFRIQRTLNVGPLLENIFNIFKLNFDYFKIKLLPSKEKKNKGGN